MEQPDQRQLIKKYLDTLLRRKKIVIACLLFGIVGGLWTYVKSPKIYQSVSLIKYQRQQINPTRMSPDDLRTRTREAVDTIAQQVTSRSNLEDMIKQFDMYTTARSNLPMEDVVNMMRRNINISPDRSGDIFQVIFEGSIPRKVMLVTNAIAAKIIEENLRVRQERASETSAYVSDELAMAKDALDKKETVMRDYKLKYYNEMPDQRENNMNRLNALQEQSQNSQSSIHDMERTKVMVQEQISLREELYNQQVAAASSQGIFVQTLPGTQQLGGVAAEINRIRMELSSLQARYTEKHPEVKRLKKILADLEAQQEIVFSGEEGAEESGQIATSQRFYDPQIDALKRQLKDMQYNISYLKKERKETRMQIEQYQKWVEAAPVREAEWVALTRDYEQFQRHYQELVSRSLEAESAYTLERKQKGSQFKIIDPAHFPETPIRPSFKKIMFMAVGLGISLGCCIVFGLELLDTSFKSSDEIEDLLELPVICAIPQVMVQSEKVKSRMYTILWTFVFIVSVCGVGAILVYMWQEGMIIL